MPQAEANGVTIEYDILGPVDAEPVLLIMGLGGQMIRWTDGFRQALADHGYRVIRFDNRDVGLSTHFHEAPALPYTLYDMANDAAALLDVLGIERAHIVGVSMGGRIAQLVASEHPHRTLSLTSIMSSTGNPALPAGTPEAIAALAVRPPSPFEDEEGFLAHAMRTARLIGSPGFPFDEAAEREQSLEATKRAYDPAGLARQFAAVTATGDLRARLAIINAPTLVIHGAADPLAPLAGGHDTAANIKGAKIEVIEGMGHDIPPALYEAIARAIAAHAKAARQPV